MNNILKRIFAALMVLILAGNNVFSMSPLGPRPEIDEKALIACFRDEYSRKMSGVSGYIDAQFGVPCLHYYQPGGTYGGEVRDVWVWNLPAVVDSGMTGICNIFSYILNLIQAECDQYKQDKDPLAEYNVVVKTTGNLLGYLTGTFAYRYLWVVKPEIERIKHHLKDVEDVINNFFALVCDDEYYDANIVVVTLDNTSSGSVRPYIGFWRHDGLVRKGYAPIFQKNWTSENFPQWAPYFLDKLACTVTELTTPTLVPLSLQAVKNSVAAAEK